MLFNLTDINSVEGNASTDYQEMSGFRRAHYFRKAGGGLSCIPAMPLFEAGRGVEEAVPMRTIMSAYKMVANHAYGAMCMCEQEDEVFVLIYGMYNILIFPSSGFNTAANGREIHSLYASRADIKMLTIAIQPSLTVFSGCTSQLLGMDICGNTWMVS